MANVGQLVTDYNDVMNNMKQFNRDVLEMLEIKDQLTQFKHWYYIPHLNLFGPSKFIGYKQMDANLYELIKKRPSAESQKVLSEWFYPVQADSIEETIIREQLTSLLDLYEKKPRTNAVFHIPKNTILLISNRHSVS
ncbi:hypothetical protein [Bacillus sp. PS06]|uniref:hypothetical protein n=1 Tax=Bacillus sp. PS06 TaxID=2764176 RepID=UPI00178711D2|nr:hypothetical protein [Bacillus sp. PS06]MBD8068523.1 hypothetical protein [Bacillus sp. PS06]